MKTRLKRHIAAAMGKTGVFLLFLCISAIYATSFTDGHIDGTLSGTCTTHNRGWVEKNGYVRACSLSQAGFCINNNTCADNGTMFVKMIKVGRDSGFCGGVVFRYTSSSNYYFACAKPGNGNGWVKLCKNTTRADSGVVVASGLTIDTAFGLKVVLSRDTFSFSVNSTAIGNVVDSSNKTGGGGYGYSAAYNPLFACFDSISWTDANAENNLALNRPAFSSSNESSCLVPGKAVDGNSATRWSSHFCDPQWIYVDLGQVYSLNKVVLVWERAYGKNYKIQVSNNVQNWTDVYTRTNGTGGTEVITFSSTQGRYVRMYGTARGTCYGYSLYEFKIYGTGAPANNAPTDIALSKADVDENLATGTLVGRFSTIDADSAQGHTYMVVSGEGSDDNAFFTISGDSLKTGQVFDYETKNTFHIRVRTTDNGTGNLTYEKSFLIIVNSVNGEDYKTWNFSRKIVLNTSSSGANVAGTVAKFPVLLRLNKGNFHDFNKTMPGGVDIRFSRKDTIHLKYEIERWVDGGGDNDTAEIWVLVDTVFGNNSSQYITMYYGKEGVSTKSYSKAVFDTANGFAGAWHLEDNPGSTAPQIKDATYNGLSGTSGGSMTSADLTTGIIGKAIHFDGSNDRLDFGNGAKVDITGHNSLTFSTWVKFNALISSTRYDVMKKGDHQYGLQKINATDNKVQFSIYDGGWRIAKSNNDVDTTNWFFLTGVYNGANDSVFLYVNGTKQTIAAKASGGISSSRNDALNLGRCSEGQNFYFPGKMDDAVLSKTARSGNWIKLSYENQKIAQTLVSLQDTASLLDGDNDGVPNIVEAAIGKNVTSSDLAIPDKWINTPDSDQVVHYDYSHFVGYGGFTNVKMTIRAGVDGSVFNPVIRIVDSITQTPPTLPNYHIIGKFDIKADIQGSSVLSFPFPIRSEYQYIRPQDLILEHYNTDAGTWGMLTLDSAMNNVAYYGVVHNEIFVYYAPTDTGRTVRYVDSSATGNNNGTSWLNAFRDLSPALNMYADSAAFRKIDFWVAKGTYKPTQDTFRDASFMLFNNVRIFGGFPSQPSQQITFDQRNPSVNTTILSGDIGQQGNISDNSFSVVRAEGTICVMDGFSITGGNTQGFTISGGGTRAAGLDLSDPLGATIANCTFEENNGTNGVISSQQTFLPPVFTPDTIKILDCQFYNNKGDGGALTNPGQRVACFKRGRVEYVVDKCVFAGNYGTSIDVGNYGAAGITNSVIANNNNGSAIDLYSNCAECKEIFVTSAAMTNCTFINNKSANFGGAIMGKYLPNTALKNCILWNNSADSGGSEICLSGYYNAGNVHIANNDVQGGISGAKCFYGSGFTDEGGNINAYPQFADTSKIAGDDGVVGTWDDGLKLQAGSACRDTCPVAGAPSTDIIGIPRPQGTKVDMGAYEYYTQATVHITSPPNYRVVTTNSVVVGFIRNGNSGDTTCALPNDTNRIIVSAIDLSGAIVSDSVIILKIPNYHSPVLLLYNPSKDTVVYTNSITIHYRIDTASHDSIVSLNEGFNNVGVSITDAMGKVISASVNVLYKKANTCYAFARAPQTAFTYQTIYLDGRVTQNLLGFPTKYKWRQIQISGDYVCIYDSTAVITPVLTHGYGTLKFQMEVRDEAGTLAPAYDTVTVSVAEPQNIFDFTNLLTYNKYGADNGPQITVTSPGMEASYYTTADTMELSGTALGNTSADTVWWYVIPGTANGRFVPQGNDWSRLKVPVSTGDNLITLVYTDDSWAHVAVDRLHVSKGPASVRFGDFTMNPDAFWIDSMMQFSAKIGLSGAGIASVHLWQIKADYEEDKGAMSNDSIDFWERPKKDSVYHYRVEVNDSGRTVKSAVYTYFPQVKYSDSLDSSMALVDSVAASRYFSLKQNIGQQAAMDSIVKFLLSQTSITLAGIGPGGKAICWEHDCGVHVLINDAPVGTKGKGLYKAKGLSPYLWDFGNNDDGASGNAYDQLRPDTTLFDVDSLLKNQFAIYSHVSIEDWKGWENYKTIVISTHGNTFGYDSAAKKRYYPTTDTGRMNYSFWAKPFNLLYTYVKYNPILKPYWKDMTSSRIYPRIVIVIENDPYTGSNLKYYGLTPSFFKQYCNNLNGTLLYVSACRSLYHNLASYGSLWNVFNKKGVAAMMGYTDYVYPDFAAKMGTIVYKNLVKGDTLKYAFDSAFAYCKLHNSESGHFHIFGDSLPADSSDSLGASRFKYEGDSNFVFRSPFYMVNLQDYDTLTSSQTTLDYYLSLKSFYDTIPSDSIILIKDARGQEVPLLQKDSAMRIGAGKAIFRFDSLGIHAKNIYISAGIESAFDTLYDSTLSWLTFYYHKNNAHVVVQDSFVLFKNIRPCARDDLSPCSGHYRVSDISKWENLDSVSIVGNTYYLDMVKFQMVDSIKGYNLDSVIITNRNLSSMCDYGSNFFVTVYAYLRIFGITIEQW